MCRTTAPPLGEVNTYPCDEADDAAAGSVDDAGETARDDGGVDEPMQLPDDQPAETFAIPRDASLTVCVPLHPDYSRECPPEKCLPAVQDFKLIGPSTNARFAPDNMIPGSDTLTYLSYGGDGVGNGLSLYLTFEPDVSRNATSAEMLAALKSIRGSFYRTQATFMFSVQKQHIEDLRYENGKLYMRGWGLASSILDRVQTVPFPCQGEVTWSICDSLPCHYQRLPLEVETPFSWISYEIEAPVVFQD